MFAFSCLKVILDLIPSTVRSSRRAPRLRFGQPFRSYTTKTSRTVVAKPTRQVVLVLDFQYGTSTSTNEAPYSLAGPTHCVIESKAPQYLPTGFSVRVSTPTAGAVLEEDDELSEGDCIGCFEPEEVPVWCSGEGSVNQGGTEDWALGIALGVSITSYAALNSG